MAPPIQLLTSCPWLIRDTAKLSLQSLPVKLIILTNTPRHFVPKGFQSNTREVLTINPAFPQNNSCYLTSSWPYVQPPAGHIAATSLLWVLLAKETSVPQPRWPDGMPRHLWLWPGRLTINLAHQSNPGVLLNPAHSPVLASRMSLSFASFLLLTALQSLSTPNSLSFSAKEPASPVGFL